MRRSELANGREFTASLIDISISGAALRVDFQPPLGARVVVGSTAAQVVRHIDLGIAVEFMRPFPADEFNDETRL